MPEFNVHEAKSNLSRLLALVEQGEAVTIMRGGEPVADLVRHRRKAGRRTLGALAGTIIGASVISVHLLVSHPQATLENGTVLLFTLSEPLNLVPAAPTGN